MESSWLVGAKIAEPVADLEPEIANELWVVSHEYLLNGNPLIFPQPRPRKFEVNSPEKWTKFTVILEGKKKKHTSVLNHLSGGNGGLMTSTSGPRISVRRTRGTEQAGVAVIARSRTSFSDLIRKEMNGKCSPDSREV